MDNKNLPPLPLPHRSGPEVCAIVRLYLAVIDDLSEEQIALLQNHIATCAACAGEFRVLERATWLVGSAVATAPSPRVDAAIRTLVAGRERPSPAPVYLRPRPAPRRRIVSLAGALVSAAVVALALFATLHFSSTFQAGNQAAFTLPANVSWNGYVLYHSETRTAADGHLYEVDSYDELGTGDMRVETKMDNQLDIIAVGNNQETMGMDTIHHVAQMGAGNWMVDDSMFNLAQLRHDIQIKDAVYLGTATFRGQKVYRIRCRDGLVMLLDMQYRPVNVLRGAAGPGTGEPIYTSVQMLLPSQVSPSMWDMNVPPGYHMGTLPATP